MVDFIDQRVGSSTACVLHTAINGSSEFIIIQSQEYFFFLRKCLQSMLTMECLLNEGIFFNFL